MEHFQQPRFRTLRAAMFAGLGLWGIVPAVHGYMLYHGIAIVKKAVAWDALMGVVYLVRSCQPCYAYCCRRLPSSLPTGSFGYAHSVTAESCIVRTTRWQSRSGSCCDRSAQACMPHGCQSGGLQGSSICSGTLITSSIWQWSRQRSYITSPCSCC